MRLHVHIPSSPLLAFVEDFRLYQGYAGARPRELILPSGTFEMVFNLRDDELRIYDPAQPHQFRRFAGAVISGPYVRPFMTDAQEETAILQVHFRPGGAFPVLGIPVGEFTDRHVDLRAIWGSPAAELRERLCTLKDPAAKFGLLERTLMARLMSAPARHPSVGSALAILMRTHGGTKIRDVATAEGLSQRRLADLFATEVGLTPKLFGRLQRFLRALAYLGRGAHVDWAGIATDCGYFDQSHLIRDFVAFSGISPTVHLRYRAELMRAGSHMKRNHLPVAS